MNMKQEIGWWVYVVIGIVLVFFAAPALVSAPDTISVLLGIMGLVAYGVWSYHFWVKRTAIFLINKLKELNK
jgi:hypothetical protein